MRQLTCAAEELACTEQNGSVFSCRRADTARKSEATLPLSPRGTLVLRLYAAESILEPANIGVPEDETGRHHRRCVGFG